MTPDRRDQTRLKGEEEDRLALEECHTSRGDGLRYFFILIDRVAATPMGALSAHQLLERADDFNPFARAGKSRLIAIRSVNLNPVKYEVGPKVLRPGAQQGN